MKFRFSLKTNIIGGILICLMLYASAWQWQRHLYKIGLIEELNRHLESPIVPFSELFASGNPDWATLIHRRVAISGTYDFEHEITLRNRRHDDMPGAFVITPLKIDGTDKTVLVNRGFIPYARMDQNQRKIFQRPPSASFTGLIKESTPPKIFSPADPPSGPGHPWVDAWLRVDVPRIAAQLPYAVLPIFLEIMDTSDIEQARKEIIQSKSGRDDLFFMPSKAQTMQVHAPTPLDKFPIPVFDIVVPPGRHLGYVFEWALMALMTFLICVVIQFRRPKQQS